jgi:hypothetical protein
LEGAAVVQPSADTDEQPPGAVPRREEEVLIPDVRGQLTPAQMVERKLVAVLEVETYVVPVSHLQGSVKRRPQ